jgi:energy-coupling factor transport system substrate-specific component
MTPIDAKSLPGRLPRAGWTGRALSVVILALATAFGIGAFIYPFFAPSPRTSQSAQQMFAHSQDAPFIFLATIVLCLIVVVINLETKRMNSKVIAVLGIMVAINAVLRLVPGFVGFSAMFFLPILCGYAYGADFGFLLGALSLLVSAVVTNGMGPWLPYQMFAAGWMGMAAAWLPDLSRLRWVETAVLSFYGAVLGLVFGAVMDLWFWPYLLDPQQIEGYWQPGYGPLSAALHFLLFYLSTSLWWDMGRAVGNLLLIALFGPPILRLLRRFKRRFTFQLV